MKITQKQFWEVLSTIKFKDRWQDGYIRKKGESCTICPVCAVANKLLGKTKVIKHYLDFVGAAAATGLDLQFARLIAAASDGKVNRLRPKLLKVLGIPDYLKKEVKK